MTEVNRSAWNAQQFAARTTAFGITKAKARRIIADPERTIGHISCYIRSIADKRIWNLQVAHSRTAVALALLDTKVQAIDFLKTTTVSCQIPQLWLA